MSTSLARTNSMSETVKERRLRPLYDLLDAGNCKKVLQEADKLLKKHPNFTCAKVFKAMAYMKVGKLDECMTIMNQVTEEGPADDATLHAMQICFRELNMPERIVHMYEVACSKEKCEDYMTCLFMAHVRVMDFQSQHKIALQLYKTFSKRTYLVWAVVSLFVKAELADNPQIATTITLPLASKMMEKFIGEGTVCAEHEYYLHIVILFKMKQFQKALTVLEESKSKQVVWNKYQYDRLELSCLKKLEDEERLLATLEKSILEDSSVFTCYRDYVLTFAETKTERLINFLKPIAYDSTTTELNNRSALLALIWLYEFLDTKGAPCQLDIRQLFVDYMQKFGSKPFFLRDMKRIVCHLKRKGEGAELAQLSEELIGNNDKFQSMQRAIQWKTNFDTLKFYLHQEQLMSTPFRLLDYIKELWKRYSEASHLYTEKQFRLDERDAVPYEDYLVTMTVILSKTFWSGSTEFWDHFLIDDKLQSLDLKKHEEHLPQETPQENGLANSESSSNIFSEQEFPILLNLVLLEEGVRNSPYCSPYRYLLGRLYFFCGCATDGLEQLMKLDIKHMQFDSTGYMFIPKILLSGSLGDAGRTIFYADSFYSNSSNEFLEHVISAYKYCSWSQITDFLDFRSMIHCSVQASTMKVEKRLFEYTVDGVSRDSMVKISLKDDVDLREIFTRKFCDNRDFKLGSFLFESDLPEEVKTRSFADSVETLKTRSAILAAMSNYAAALTFTSDDTLRYVPCISRAEEALELIAIQKNTPYDLIKSRASELYLHGPWPPRLYDYVESGFVSCLYDFLLVVKCAEQMSVAKDSATSANMNEIEKTMEAPLQSVKKITQAVNNLRTSQHGLHQLCALNEDIFVVMETLGFLCIILDLVKGYLERTKPNSGDSKGKKKKSKEVPTTAPWGSLYKDLTSPIISCLSRLESELSDLEAASKSWFDYNWAEEELVWKEKVPQEFLNLLEANLPQVSQKLRTNFVKAYSQMKTNTTRKRQYAESLITN